ncbi:MAG: DUF5050 domain-containing protein [Clostridia bacterium]|nr:DUF5050 domain-containing protein [Clostridia bacterium]
MYKFTKKMSMVLALILLLSFSGISVFAESEQVEGDLSTEADATKSYGPINSIRVWENDNIGMSYNDTSSPINVDLAKKVGNWIYYNKSSFNYGISRVQKSAPGKSVAYSDPTRSMYTSGQWVYYQNGSDKDKLYRVKNDGTGKKKVSDDVIYNYEISGDWIIYSNTSKNNTLYRMKGDGTAKAAVLSTKNIDSFRVFGSYILYSNPSDGKLFTVKIDGKGNKKLTDSYISLYSLTYADGYVFYRDFSNGGKVVKLKVDGSQKASVVVSETINNLGVSKGWVYYTNRAKNYSLFRVKYDGIGNKKALSTGVGYFEVQGDYIYYSDVKGTSISRMKTDGSSKIKVCDFSSYGFIVAKDNVYFYNYKDNSWIKVKADGKQKKEKITYEQFLVDSDTTNNKFVWIYSRETESALYKIDASTGEKKEIVGDSHYMYTLYGDYAFYTDMGANIFRTKLDGTGTTRLYEGSIDYFRIDGGWVYFSNYDYSTYEQNVYRIKADGNNAKPEKINTKYTNIDNIYNGWLYYTDRSSGALSRMNLDTKAEEKISDNVVTWKLAKGYLFYSKEENNALVSMPLDGSETKTVTQLETDSVLIGDGWIFYNNIADDSFLYKVKFDGSEKTKVASKSIYLNYNVKLAGDWIIYTDSFTGKLMRIKLDGSQDVAITTDNINDWKVVDDTVYYTINNAKGLYSIKLDGTAKTTVTSQLENYPYYNVAGEWIFYISYGTYNADTYRIKAGQKAAEKL